MFFSAIRNYKKSTVWRLLGENIETQKVNYTIAIIAMVVAATATALTAWIIKDIIDAITESDQTNRVLMVAFSVMIIFIFKGLASYIQNVFLARAGNAIIAAQQSRAYSKLLRQGAAYFNMTESSDLLMRITQSAQSARIVIDTIVTGFTRDTLTLIGLLCVMFYQQPILSAVSLTIGPLALFGTRIIMRKVRSITALELESLAEILKVLQETSQGIMVIKAFSLEDKMSERMNFAIKQVQNRANAIVRLGAIPSPLMESLSGFAIAGVVALGAFNPFDEASTTSASELASFMTALIMAYDPAKRLLRMRVAIETNMVSVQKMYDLIDAPDTMIEEKHPAQLADGPEQVEFKDVCFEYSNGKQVLDKLDLVCEAGKTLALVGPSGGGKSTILNLILRLYDPTSGKVLVNGTDIRKLALDTLREKISFVGQNTFLFSASIMENIQLGRLGASKEEIIKAAKAAHAHKFIEKLPQKYDTQVGENGVFLSGGQRQRLAIARAILKDAPILLLDEATSALDSQSETLIQDALANLTQGKTTIVIAHRLSTVIEADRICVIDSGKIIEQGTKDELLAQDGLFRSLYDQQFKSAG